MKILRSSLIGMFILLMTTVSASAETLTPNELLPGNTELLLTLNPDGMNDTIKEWYFEVLNTWLDSDIFGEGYFLEMIEEGTPAYAASEFTKELLEDFPLYMGGFTITTTTDYDYEYESLLAIVVLEMEEDDFEDHILPYLEDEESFTTSDTYEITAYENAATGTAFAFTNDLLLIGEEAESLYMVLEEFECRGDCEGALYANESYQEISSHMYDESGLDFYMADFSDMDELSNILYSSSGSNLFESIGFSLKEEEGFHMKIYIENNPEAFEELGINTNNSQALSLYEYMPSDDVIYFSDSSETAMSAAIMQDDEAYGFIAEEFEDETGFDLTTLLSIIENEMAIAIQDDGDVLPSLTVLGDLNGDADEIKENLDAIVEEAWEALKEEADAVRPGGMKLYFNDEDVQMVMERSEMEMGSNTMDEFTVTFKVQESKNPYAATLDMDLLEFSFVIGVTDDNLLLFSSHNDIENTYGEGITDTEVTSLITSSTDQVSYLGVHNLSNYINSALEQFGESIPAEFVDITAAQDYMDTLLDPWTSITATGTTTNSYGEYEISVLVDFDGVMSSFASAMQSTPDFDLSFIDNMQEDYDDVDPEEWYGDDVYYLTTKGYISGYGDGTYLPEKSISRAEFLKLVIEALNDEGYIYHYKYGSSYINETFSDVDDYEWYSSYIQTAYDEGITSGYEDGTFHPDSPIARAEVAALLKKVVDTYEIEAEDMLSSLPSFSDINTTDWYYGAVKSVYQNKIMDGTDAGTFDPYREINRAESAKVIRGLLELM